VKHERFAQELAKGSDAGDAYEAAGFKPNPGNARRLKMNEAIAKRVEALLLEREAHHAQATAIAIEKTGLSKEWIIERLMRNAAVALADEPVTLKVLMKGAKEPTEVKISAHDAAAANRALELLGKELGMFIDRKEIRTGELDGVNESELRELRSLLVAGEAGGAEIAGRPGPRSKPH